MEVVSPQSQCSSSSSSDAAGVPSCRPRKRKHAAKKEDLMNWLEEYKVHQVAAEERRLELARKIHDDNMNVLSGLVDVLKQAVRKQ